MKNREFEVGSHIVVQGFRGIVTSIMYCNEYKVDFDGKCIGNGLEQMTDEVAEETRNRGYNVLPTGRTSTYFTVSFETEENLKNTSYDGGRYGCLDEYEMYGTW